MKVRLSYAEKILNALSRTTHKRGDLIGNMQRDADAINEVLKPLFDERNAARREVEAMRGVVEAAQSLWHAYDPEYGVEHKLIETLGDAVLALAEARKGNE